MHDEFEFSFALDHRFFWCLTHIWISLELLAGEEVYLRGADGFPNGQVRGDEDGASGFAGHLIMQTS